MTDKTWSKSWISIFHYISLPRIYCFPHRERRIVQRAHGLFIVFAGLFLLLTIQRAENLFTQTKNHLQADASLTAYRVSMQISSLVNQRYADLNFLKSFL